VLFKENDEFYDFAISRGKARFLEFGGLLDG